MDRYLSHYCDLYDIEYTQNHAHIEQIISANPQKKIETWHPRGYMFFALQQLVQGNISQEDFFHVGDIDSPFPCQQFPGMHPAGLTAGEAIYQSLIDNATVYTDTICIVHETIYRYMCYHTPDIEELLAAICRARNTEFLYCS